jgi:arsenate reductase (thioredoxin)
MAEALLNVRGQGRIVAESAGSRPAARVNPHAVEALAKVGIDWAGHAPRGIDGLEHTEWDAVITVCDDAKEACPIFPGHPVMVHWGMDDPADTTGGEVERQGAFDAACALLTRRIDAMLALPLESAPVAQLAARITAAGRVR